MHRPPYMDVQTVKTNLTVDQAAKLEGQSHCFLLVEPVLLPNLGHTGVVRETLPGDRPLFYPNGFKNCTLGSTVRNALYQSTTNPSGVTATAGVRPQYYGHQQQQHAQSPPSDWAGSSAYYSLPSSDSSSCYESHKPRYSSREKHSDEASASAAIPAGQGGRFPTDVWGTPPGGETGGSNNGSNSRCGRRRRLGAGVRGTGEARIARHPESEGTDSGSIVDRRLPRYTGRELGAAGVGCSSQESLLAGRTAEALRAQQQQRRRQQLQQQ
ncbi:unnamed protein product, partial [Ectocarpus sp. 13 AM-2016]